MQLLCSNEEVTAVRPKPNYKMAAASSHLEFCRKYIRSEGKTVSGPWTVISSILHNNEHTQNVHTLLSTQSRIRIVDMLILNDLVA